MVEIFINVCFLYGCIALGFNLFVRELKLIIIHHNTLLDTAVAGLRFYKIFLVNEVVD